MRRFLLSILVLLISSTATFGAPHHRAMLISVDGMMPDCWQHPEHYGLRIPNLRRMVGQGSYARALRSVLPPVTYPNHTTMATGVRPLRHGIPANQTLEAHAEHPGEWFWYSRDIKAPTLWDVAQSHHLKAATISWPVSLGAHSTWNIPEYTRYSMPADFPLLDELCHPQGLLTTLAANGINCTGPPFDGFLAAAALWLLGHDHPDLLMLHLVDLDHAQHIYGPGSPEAIATLEHEDELLGKLEQTAGPDTNLVIVSDHGFSAVTEEIHLGVALHEFGKSVRLMDAGGYSAVYFPAANAEMEKRVHDILANLVGKPDSGLTRLVERAELDTWRSFPGAAFAVEAKPGYHFGSGEEGALVVPSRLKGAHGFRPDQPDQQASFLALGPDVKSGAVIDLAYMEDVAPTVAALLHFTMPDAEGRVLTEFLR